ncbi:MAG TPA: hypothetical protein PK098_10980 [Phycisphaerales bacterium]|nr:hypothetical protein [Phycisphaerales bacterium]
MLKRLSSFVAAAVLAAGLGTVAHASPIPGQGIVINGVAGPEFGGTFWGSAVQGDHAFGGTSVYNDPFFPSFFVTVTSGVIPPDQLPQGKKFGGYFEINFTNFAPGDFTNHSIVIGPLKQPGQPNHINFVGLDGVGNVGTDGYNIVWEGLGAALAQSPVVFIYWFQVPAPGALALLGVAGLVGVRRRRD